MLAWTLGTFGDDLPKGTARDTGLLVPHFGGSGHPDGPRHAVGLAGGRAAAGPETNEFGRWLGALADPAARHAHYTLYALLVAVPIAGIVAQFARGNALPLFGLGEIASPWIRDRAFAHNVTEIHEILTHALVIVASFHAAAALIHHFAFRDNTLIRMLPGGKR